VVVAMIACYSSNSKRAAAALSISSDTANSCAAFDGALHKLLLLSAYSVLPSTHTMHVTVYVNRITVDNGKDR
jgi:hypothetical protein